MGVSGAGHSNAPDRKPGLEVRARAWNPSSGGNLTGREIGLRGTVLKAPMDILTPISPFLFVVVRGGVEK